MRVLIIGCGYIGMTLGAELARQGHEVFGLRRSSESAAALQAVGIHPLHGDITHPDSLATLPTPFDWVVNCVASSHGGAEDYRRVYYEGTERLLAWLAKSPPRKYVYTSSTSVYFQDDGSQVKETSPTTPEPDTSRILVETEQLLLRQTPPPFPIVILRLAGIYGPERNHYLQRFLGREIQIEGLGMRFLNMIHRDDVVGCLQMALQSGHAGEIYNVVDDEPVHQVHFFRWLSETLGMAMPPFVADDATARRKRGLTNKRVSNRKLKMELGYQFKYPTFRQGYTAEIQRLEQAGQLDLT